MQIPLSQILITDRQRLEMDEQHILNLMASFKDIGQVQAVLVCVTSALDLNANGIQYRIIAGATRCTAALRLGWTHIRADTTDKADSTSIIKAEYVENALRRDLPWQDSCLALAKLHSAISVEKALIGERWDVKLLSIFTGYSNVNMHYMLKVAEMLSVEPRDEQVWNAGGFMPAFQVYLGRQDVLAVQELERRKQALAIHETPLGSDVVYDGEALEQSGEIKLLNPTIASGILPPVQCRIYGNTTPKPGMYSLAVVYKPIIDVNQNGLECSVPGEALYTAIKPGGYLVLVGVHLRDWALWEDFSTLHGFRRMSFPVIWDKQQCLPRTAWPFVPNHTLCMLLEKPMDVTTTLHPNPAMSVIQSFPTPDDLTLPIAVVSHLVLTLCPPGEPVLNPDCSCIFPLLELGHTPVWTKMDGRKYVETRDAIAEWYHTNIPGCEVVE